MITNQNDKINQPIETLWLLIENQEDKICGSEEDLADKLDYLALLLQRQINLYTENIETAQEQIKQSLKDIESWQPKIKMSKKIIEDLQKKLKENQTLQQGLTNASVEDPKGPTLPHETGNDVEDKHQSETREVTSTTTPAVTPNDTAKNKHPYSSPDDIQFVPAPPTLRSRYLSAEQILLAKQIGTNPPKKANGVSQPSFLPGYTTQQPGARKSDALPEKQRNVSVPTKQNNKKVAASVCS